MIELTDKHEYFVDGTRLPGFSEIAEKMGLVKYFNRDEFYLARGQAVHVATAMMDMGILDEESVDERIRGYVNAYRKFRDEQPFHEWKHTEESLNHPIYRFCGTPDRFLPLLDIKTGASDPIQLEAYAELLRANSYDPGRQGYMLRLKEDGTYKLETHRYDRKLLGVFLSAVSVFHYRKERGLL
jgi:hypothetical protein